MTEERSWTRREFGEAAVLLALVVGVPATVVHLSDFGSSDAPTPRQRLLMREVSQLVIPRTDTPGAGEVGTDEFVILALAHGLDGTRAAVTSAAAPAYGGRMLRGDGSLRHIDWLEDDLNRRAGGDFLRQAPASRAMILAQLDREAFSSGPPAETPSPWQKIKGLVLTGYYTSQIGGSKELRYELVPGRFDPDLPLAPTDRAWSSDWTAVEFG